MKRRVVVTGLGLISPLGKTVEESWNGLVNGRSGAAPIQRFDPSELDVRFACEVKDFDPTEYMDRKEAKRADLFAQYAISAAEQAMRSAGLDNGLPKPKQTGVLIGSGIGGIWTFEEQCKLYLQKGPRRVSPFFIPMFIPDMASGLISIRTGAKGPNYCTVSACASSAHALGEAYKLIRSGTADMMIAGGAEAAVTPLSIAGFANMRALSTRNDEPEKASRPFDADRDGFVMGDGASVLILEHLDSALDRGATIHGEIIGYGMSADAFHMTQPPDTGEGAKLAMEMCLADAAVAPSDVEYINSHGTATPHGDIAETVAVKDLFGDQARNLVMNSTKSMTGHLLGAAGGLEFTICLLVMQKGIIPPTINIENQDPRCDLDCAPNEAVKRDVTISLTNSFGFGGHNVSLAVRKFEG